MPGTESACRRIVTISISPVITILAAAWCFAVDTLTAAQPAELCRRQFRSSRGRRHSRARPRPDSPARLCADFVPFYRSPAIIIASASHHGILVIEIPDIRVRLSRKECRHAHVDEREDGMVSKSKAWGAAALIGCAAIARGCYDDIDNLLLVIFVRRRATRHPWRVASTICGRFAPQPPSDSWTPGWPLLSTRRRRS